MAIPAEYGSSAPLKKTTTAKKDTTRQAVGSPLGTMTLQAPYAGPSAAASIGSGLGLGATGGGTTTRTVTPLQVYQEQILADPGAVAAEGIFTSQKTNLANARADAIKKALITGGWAPKLEGELAGYSSDVTPSALAEAAANPMSQRAQLDRQLSEAKTNLPYDLAARGAGRSGALPIQLGNFSRQYDVASYQGQQDLLTSITNAINNWTGGHNQALSALEAARREIAARLAQQAGFSESIVTTGGDEGGGGYEEGYSDDWLPPANPNELSPSYPAPVINQTVQKAIKALGYKTGSKAPADLYRTIRQTFMGG